MNADTTALEYKDRFGVNVKVGDFVAYGVGGKSAQLHVGLVTALSSRADYRYDYSTTPYQRVNFATPALKVKLYDEQAVYDYKRKEHTGEVIMSARNATTGNFDAMMVIPSSALVSYIVQFLQSDVKTLTKPNNKTKIEVDLADL